MKDKTLTFHRLYKRYVMDVYRFAYWLCGDKDEAQDITSETFVRVWTAGTETKAEIDRTVLIMMAENDMSYREISLATGLSVSAIKVKIFRARIKINKILQEGNIG